MFAWLLCRRTTCSSATPATGASTWSAATLPSRGCQKVRSGRRLIGDLRSSRWKRPRVDCELWLLLAALQACGFVRSASRGKGRSSSYTRRRHKSNGATTPHWGGRRTGERAARWIRWDSVFCYPDCSFQVNAILSCWAAELFWLF